MKITAVRTKVWQWKGEVVAPSANFCTNAMDALYDRGDAMSAFRFHSWMTCEIETDTGLVGIGNAALAPRVAQEIIDEYYTPLVIGQDPWDYEYLWQRMYRSGHTWNRRGVGMVAISAIDIAIWDVLGKAVGQPVFKLLGGRTKEKIPVYASKLYSGPIDAMQKEAESYLDQGFDMFKMRFGWGPKDGPKGVAENLKRVAAIREVIGYETDLMLDAYSGWNLEYTKRILPALAEFSPRWLEEPVIADDMHGYAELNNLGIVPISGGEHEYNLFGFRQMLDMNALSVIQYDTNRVGGITAAQKINHLAEAYQVPVVPHAGQMHNYHLTMANTNCPMSEFFPVSKVEVGNELFYYIFEGDPEPKDGFIDLDDSTPGLGLTLSEQYLSDFETLG